LILGRVGMWILLLLDFHGLPRHDQDVDGIALSHVHLVVRHVSGCCVGHRGSRTVDIGISLVVALPSACTRARLHGLCLRFLHKKSYDIGVKLRARALMTLPDSTSQKFLLLGSVARHDQSNDVGRVVIVYLDFSKTRTRECGEDDFVKWYARPAKTECLMGHKVCLFVTDL